MKRDIYIQQYIDKLEELMIQYKRAKGGEQELLAVELAKTLFSFINTGYQLPIKSNGIITFGDKIIDELFTSKDIDTFVKI